LIVGSAIIIFSALQSSAQGEEEGGKHVPVAPGVGPGAEVEATQAQLDGMAQAHDLADLRTELERQKAAFEALRKEVENKLASEQASRDAAVARARAEAIAESKKDVRPWMRWISFSGYAQTDVAIRQSSSDQLNTSTGEPLNQDRFLLRRARLATSVERGYVAGLLELDANTVNGPQVRPIHFETSVRWPSQPGQPSLVGLTAGLFKIPFGQEVLQGDTQRLFMERSAVVQEFFPGEFDLGARLAGGWRFLRYALAVQNGEPVGTKAFPQRDPNGAKDVVGRLGLEAAMASDVDASAGFSALTGRGFHKGVAPTKAGVAWNDRNEDNSVTLNELVATAAKAAVPSQNFVRSAFGLDARLNVQSSLLGTSSLYGEVMWGRNLGRGTRFIADPVAVGRDISGFGYNLALVQDISSYGQLGVRYDYYDPDRDHSDLQAAQQVVSSLSYQTWAFAAAVRLPGARLIAEYDLNRNHNGRDSAGMPVNLADNAFILRAEVTY
jgi:hypothetical protein